MDALGIEHGDMDADEGEGEGEGVGGASGVGRKRKRGTKEMALVNGEWVVAPTKPKAPKAASAYFREDYVQRKESEAVAKVRLAA